MTTKPFPEISPDADLPALVSALAYAYAALDSIANAPEGFDAREMRQRGWAAMTETRERLRLIDKDARRRAR